MVASLFDTICTYTLWLVLPKYPQSQIPIFVILGGVLNDPNEIMLVHDDYIIIVLFTGIVLYMLPSCFFFNQPLSGHGSSTAQVLKCIRLH